MKTGVNNQEVIIKGRDRKELMGQYFEVVLLPKIKEQSVTNQKTSTFSDEQEQLSLFNKDVNQDDEGYIEYIDLKRKE